LLFKKTINNKFYIYLRVRLIFLCLRRFECRFLDLLFLDLFFLDLFFLDLRLPPVIADSLNCLTVFSAFLFLAIFCICVAAAAVFSAFLFLAIFCICVAAAIFADSDAGVGGCGGGCPVVVDGGCCVGGCGVPDAAATICSIFSRVIPLIFPRLDLNYSTSSLVLLAHFSISFFKSSLSNSTTASSIAFTFGISPGLHSSGI